MEVEPLMPSYRIGKFVSRPGHDRPVFRPFDTIGMTFLHSLFRYDYWLSEKDAQKFLDGLKQKYRENAEKAERFLANPDDAELFAYFRSPGLPESLDVREDRISSARNAIENYGYIKELVVGKWQEPSSVYRLNTCLRDEGESAVAKRRELEDKMRWFGHAEIGWTCFGHTRAEMQTASDVKWLEQNHPEWEVRADHDTVYVDVKLNYIKEV